MPQFSDTLLPDDPLVQSASFRFNRADRQSIDGQVIACETFLSTCVLNGIQATYGTAGEAIAIGDVLCLAGDTAGTVIVAGTAALATAKAWVGVAVEAAAQARGCGTPLRGAWRAPSLVSPLRRGS